MERKKFYCCYDDENNKYYLLKEGNTIEDAIEMTEKQIFELLEGIANGEAPHMQICEL